MVCGKKSKWKKVKYKVTLRTKNSNNIQYNGFHKNYNSLLALPYNRFPLNFYEKPPGVDIKS